MTSLAKKIELNALATNLWKDGGGLGSAYEFCTPTLKTQRSTRAYQSMELPML